MVILERAIFVAFGNARGGKDLDPKSFQSDGYMTTGAGSSAAFPSVLTGACHLIQKRRAL
jgi:hypothetical protein